MRSSVAHTRAQTTLPLPPSIVTVASHHRVMQVIYGGKQENVDDAVTLLLPLCRHGSFLMIAADEGPVCS